VLGEDSRFRVNLFYQMDGLSAVFRIIPVKILTLDELNLPEVLKTFTDIQRGLVLVTGVTGSGKSTTLAAMIDKINREQKKHIITVEDPIEFVHKDRGCLINQRGIGQDALSFSDALRAALREDPDIILVGEMRDLETIDIALHAANTGHLVFSTLHTLDAKETIDRIVGMFGNEEQNRIRMSLASVLEGVISQRLIPTKAGGRVAGIEILKKTARIEQLIAENRDAEIPDALFDGKEIYGTQTFDQALLDILRRGEITEKTALEYATNPADMKLKMQGVGKGAIIDEFADEREVDVFEFKPDEE
jgi:twitching motility protein PilT